MPNPSLSLLVLRTSDIERALAFYQHIGLNFNREQHGNGPVHYSCEVGSTIIEIYPGKPGSAPDRRDAGATLVGFQVANVAEVVECLKEKGTLILTPPQESTWGIRAVVQDPDGRAIELNQLEARNLVCQIYLKALKIAPSRDEIRWPCR